MTMSDLQRYPWNLNVIKNVEDIDVFLIWTELNSNDFSIVTISDINASVTSAENPQIEINN